MSMCVSMMSLSVCMCVYACSLFLYHWSQRRKNQFVYLSKIISEIVLRDFQRRNKFFVGRD